ncbi:flavin reductase family protein [Sinanaerobacter sp. ZZT-01]|uniref:flavin reductase family protein n=1 Tax=Sinanaerobacter sp. ZZT-01 TaxID=3111540 RepID=UPI002D777336|nr:flavin reductase family protein [Sinanaerobacter sp. ZZT-01]WRR92831.1 flavin reductase family protein [Sinanaerobacter sp. ZZT-01]
MGKVLFKPGTMLNPVPVVLVSCGASLEKRNLITVAWTGIVNSEPPMAYISVRKSRYSHAIIYREREFVINLTTEKLVKQTDYCGVKSGRDVDKFKEMELTPFQGEIVKCPMIQESPVNLECKVKEILSFPSHDMFLAEIVAVHADDTLINEKGRFQLEKAGLICYSHGEYFGLGRKPLGSFGYSIMKKKTKKRRILERTASKYQKR